jgi:siroheme synthase (precorrin-2 oxidase/ferrochelatase)
LLDQFDDGYAEWVRVLGDVRAAVLTRVTDATERRRLLEAFADPSWLERVRTAGSEVAKAEMMRHMEPGTK